MLEEKERRIILYLIIALIINCLIYLLVSKNLRNVYFSKLETYSTLRKNVLKLKSNVKKRKFELLKWQRVTKDIKDLRENYLFPSENGIAIVRKSLGKIAQEAGIYINEIDYNYIVHEKKEIGEISISFHVMDDYFNVKDFIRRIEIEPKFLIIKKVDFTSSKSSEGIKAKLYLSAYTNEK